jgi:AcrR family transcriptional regulator
MSIRQAAVAPEQFASPAKADNAKPGPRERILATARELFHRHGIRGVGVETIAEAAGTNKMTLYRHFASKDLLIAECLRQFAEEYIAEWEDIRQAEPAGPREQLRAWVRFIGDMINREADRGCALANAAIELPDRDHPARRVIEEYKTVQRDMLDVWCREAGYPDADRLADELFLLLEGARVSLQSTGAAGPGSRLGAMMLAVIGRYERG